MGDANQNKVVEAGGAVWTTVDRDVSFALGDESTKAPAMVTQVVRLTLKAELEERMAGMEEELTKRQNLRLTQGVTEIVRSLSASKTETDNLLREYRAQYERCLENLQQMEGVHRNIHRDGENLRQSFEELTMRVKERLDAVAEMLQTFRQALLTAWDKERNTILTELKHATQRDQVLVVQNVETRRRELEIRLATFAKDQHAKQQDISKRVNEMEERQAKINQTMMQYWGAFERWLKKKGVDPLAARKEVQDKQLQQQHHHQLPKVERGVAVVPTSTATVVAALSPSATRTWAMPGEGGRVGVEGGSDAIPPPSASATTPALGAVCAQSAGDMSSLPVSMEEQLKRLLQTAGLPGKTPTSAGAGATPAAAPAASPGPGGGSRDTASAAVASLLRGLKEKNPHALQHLQSIMNNAQKQSGTGVGASGANQQVIYAAAQLMTQLLQAHPHGEEVVAAGGVAAGAGGAAAAALPEDPDRQ